MTTDVSIRAVLIAHLIEQHKSDSKVRIVEELGVNHGCCRIDVAVINNIMHGYEIKSDADTLDRLEEQMKSYSDVFNKVTLVVGTRHILKAINMVPEWWGIYIAKTDSNTSSIYEIRVSEDNPEWDGISAARLLWRDEALNILDDIGAAHGVKSRCRELIYSKLVNQLDPSVLREMICDTILYRQAWKADQSLQIYGD